MPARQMRHSRGGLSIFTSRTRLGVDSDACKRFLPFCGGDAHRQRYLFVEPSHGTFLRFLRKGENTILPTGGAIERYIRIKNALYPDSSAGEKGERRIDAELFTNRFGPVPRASSVAGFLSPCPSKPSRSAGFPPSWHNETNIRHSYIFLGFL